MAAAEGDVDAIDPPPTMDEVDVVELATDAITTILNCCYLCYYDDHIDNEVVSLTNGSLR